MNNKSPVILKKTVILTVFMGTLYFGGAVHALSPIREVLQEKKQILMQEKQDVKEMKTNTSSLLERAKNLIKEKIKKQLRGELVTISGNTLTVQKDTLTYTVQVTDKTQLKRKFGGNSNLSEFSPHDTLLVIGNRVKDTQGTYSATEVEATYIRNMSVQRRFAVFTGEVEAKSGTTITLKTIGRGAQTVYIASGTKVQEKNRTISFSDIHVGDKVVVKGELWDRVSFKIDAKTILKLNIKKPSLTPAIKITPEKE